jgi:hypothetical protein
MRPVTITDDTIQLDLNRRMLLLAQIVIRPGMNRYDSGYGPIHRNFPNHANCIT